MFIKVLKDCNCSTWQVLIHSEQLQCAAIAAYICDFFTSVMWCDVTWLFNIFRVVEKASFSAIDVCVIEGHGQVVTVAPDKRPLCWVKHCSTLSCFTAQSLSSVKGNTKFKSQSIHHGQEVITLAAGTGGRFSRLSELSHDLSQLSIGLFVLKWARGILLLPWYTLAV